MQNRILHFLFDELFRSSWRSVVLLWKPMAGWTILVYAVFTALLAPVLSGIVNWGVFRGDRLIVGNEELFTWFFSPSGFIYLFLILLITLTGIIIRYAGLFQIVTDDLLGRKVSVKETALHIVPRVHTLIKLCAFTLLAAALALIPFGAGLGAVYWIFLTEFDMNYYLSVTPPEWYRALMFGGIWAGCWLLFILFLAGCLLPALPAYLDKKSTIVQSIREVWSVPTKQTLHLVKGVAVAIGIWFLLRLSADALLLFLFAIVADWIHSQFDSLRLLILAAGSYLFITLSIATIFSFFGFSIISTLITKSYYTSSRRKFTLTAPDFKKLTQKTWAILQWWWAKPVRIGSIIVVFLAGSLATSILVIGNVPEQNELMVIAHRAGAPPAPENSLAALEQSIRLGAKIAEIDVQRTNDGTVVVLHDADLMRVTGDPRRITNVSYEDVSDLYLLASSNIPLSERRLPTLPDFLERAKNRIDLMIELKYYVSDPDLAPEVIRLIREHEMEEQVVLMSPNLGGVRQIRSLVPDWTTGYVSALAAGDLSRLTVQFLAVNHQNITPQLVESSQNRGVPLFAWTVNRADDMITAIEKGVDGIITDDPELAIRISEEMAQLTRTERLLLRFGLLVLDGQAVLREN